MYLLDYLSNKGLDDKELREIICMRTYPLIAMINTLCSNEQIANNNSETNLVFDVNIEV